MELDSIVNPTSVGLVITAGVSWLLGWQQRNSSMKKNTAETENTLLDMRIKEDNFEADRYSKLLDRVIKSEAEFQIVLQKLDEKEIEIRQLRESMKKLSVINQELMAEINLYKTVK